MAREARQEQGERAGVAGRCGEQEERAKRGQILPDTGGYPAQNMLFLSFFDTYAFFESSPVSSFY